MGSLPQRAGGTCFWHVTLRTVSSPFGVRWKWWRHSPSAVMNWTLISSGVTWMWLKPRLDC